MSTYKLYTDVGNFRAIKILIAAEFSQVNVEVAASSLEEAAALSPLKKIPVLVTPTGEAIFESNAIARFIARLRVDSYLYGKTVIESALVDSWVDFSAHEVELPATLWVYPVLGQLPGNPAVINKAKGDFSNALKTLENHLLDKTYLVGEQVTLADIAVASALFYPFKFVADPSFRSPFPNVLRWFTTLVNQPEFEAVIGTVVLAEKEKAADAGSGSSAARKDDKAAKQEKKPKEVKEKKPQEEKPKKEEKPKEEKKPKKKDEDDDEPEPDYVEEKKADHPFKTLDKTNPSTFVMDAWKKTYSNCTDYKEAMSYFWDNFDANGWTIFRGDYNYNDELKILFMTSNLIGGFIQRTEEIRKWLFGVMTIRGVEGPGSMKVSCYYLIRGDSIEPLIQCNDDAACYTWTKVGVPASEEDKQRLFDYWCSEGPLDGEPCLDSRVYK